MGIYDTLNEHQQEAKAAPPYKKRLPAAVHSMYHKFP